MKSRKILNIALITVLLSSLSLGAEHSDCAGGVCFAPLVKVESLKVFEEKKEVTPVKYAQEIEYIEEDSSNNNLDKSQTILLDGEKVIVFPPETYVMHTEEATEDKILEKTDLPNSDYFCEKDKQPVYLNDNTYECV